MKKITLLTLLVSVALFSLLIAGCSSTDSGSNAPDIKDTSNSSNAGSTDEESQFLACDNSGDCWGDCYGCAITSSDDSDNDEGKEGACYEVYTACQDDETCNSINTCIDGCDGDGADWLACHDKCMEDNGGDATPSAEKYYAIDTCILCEACPIDCKDDAEPGDCEAK